ncbi:MAG: hypothetical protein FWD45_04665 [Coriobacteriia bacterium]|nr:hypothetical protein [Coriobacteriia bacterium]
MGLFKPAWMSSNWKKVARAVKRTKSQQTLYRIINDAPNSYARRAALEKLTDQSLLADVARNTYGREVRLAAAKKLTDLELAQEVFADLAKMIGISDIQLAAIEQLTDQATLAEVANSISRRDVRISAAEKLSDRYLAQKAYADIASNIVFTDIASRHAAYPLFEQVLERITDQDLLGDVVKNAFVKFQPMALSRITDQAVLADIARTAFFNIRIGAVDRLIDQAVLADVAENDSVCEVRFSAAEKLTDRALAQKTYAYVAINTPADQELPYNTEGWTVLRPNHDLRMKAVGKLTDQSLLADVAINASDGFVRQNALESITDQAALAEVATSAKWLDTLNAANTRLAALRNC